MPLSAGDKLGPYEILASIGAGGMGEVYRARDTKLDRDVAIKVLPAALAHDPERLARFEREAKVLASLNHPHIAQIYGVEDQALIMELVDGTSPKGALPLETVLSYASQIAEALEAAHEKGIVHRDLKPANILVTPEGVVKVLDFGLAAVAPHADDPNPTVSPTLTMATRAGVIMGTAAYMSPEQASGKPTDKRADIWSFGVVLWELLTGHRLFQGETISHTLADVLRGPIDFDKLPRDTPASIRNLLRRCLDRNVKNRLRDIGEARVAIEQAMQGAPEVAAVPSPKRSGIPWILAGLLCVAAVALCFALWGWLRPAKPEPREVVRFIATGPPVSAVPGAIALSRDGSRMAFVGGPKAQIYVRMMDQVESKPIPGTEGAYFICFSPDGQWISYIESISPGLSTLRKIALTGGPAQVLTEVEATIGPPTQDWGADDNILFSSKGALMRIPAAGGKPQTLATPDPEKQERFFDGAQILPGGKHILMGIARTNSVDGPIVALNIDTGGKVTGETKILLDNANVGRYLPTGHDSPAGSSAGYIVYYARSTSSLMAIAFDAGRVEVKGSPVAVLDGVQGWSTTPVPYLGISDSGTLAYIPGAGSGTKTLVWVDRKGVEQPLPAPPRDYYEPMLSPDGLSIAVAVRRQGIWLYDLVRGTLHKVTSDGDSHNPIWTPDGKRLVYSSGVGSISWIAADGSGPPSILTRVEKHRVSASSVSPDGELCTGSSTTGQIWVMPLREGSKAEPFLVSQSRKVDPSFSPDGHWMAYRSDETGENEIYVTPYPGPGAKFQISTAGGIVARWSRTGRELFYVSGGKMMAVDIQTTPTFRAGTPKVLFAGKYSTYYDVSADGKRFLMVKPPAAPQGSMDQITVVLNWFEELRRRVPAGK